MTVKTTDFSSLLYYNPLTHGFNPVVEATIHCPDSMNEYDSIVVNVVTWDLPDGNLFWRVVPYGTNLTLDRFTLGSSDSTPLVSDRASFTIAVSADNRTSLDGQSFDIIISKTLNGPAIATKYGVVVNDTSQDPQLLVMDLDPANYQPAGSSTITITTTYQSDNAGLPGGVSGSYLRFDGTISPLPSVGDTFVWNTVTYTIQQTQYSEQFGPGQESLYFLGFTPNIQPIGAIPPSSSIDINHSSDGLSIRDASGQGHPGTLVNGVSYGGSGNQSYFILDGVNDYIGVPTLQSSTYTTVTMSLWFNTSSQSGSLITKELSYKTRLGASGSNVNIATLASNSGVGWQYNSGSGTSVTTNTWHHMAITISSTAITYYLDGQNVKTDTGIGVLGHNTQPFLIGSYGAGTSEFFTGKIGPSRLYNYALTNQEVADYYNATKGRYRTYTAHSNFASGSALDYIVLQSAGPPFNENYPPPGNMTGWTVTGDGFSGGQSTVTGDTQDLGGGALHIPVDQTFLQTTNDYIFTAP